MFFPPFPNPVGRESGKLEPEQQFNLNSGLTAHYFKEMTCDGKSF